MAPRCAGDRVCGIRVVGQDTVQDVTLLRNPWRALPFAFMWNPFAQSIEISVKPWVRTLQLRVVYVEEAYQFWVLSRSSWLCNWNLTLIGPEPCSLGHEALWCLSFCGKDEGILWMAFSRLAETCWNHMPACLPVLPLSTVIQKVEDGCKSRKSFFNNGWFIPSWNFRTVFMLVITMFWTFGLLRRWK